MNINLDLSFFPDYLISKITNSIEIKSFFIKNNHNGGQDSNVKFYMFEFPGSMKEFESLLNSILQKNSIKEYVVVQDTETENTLTLLKDGDMEQLGILICDFCGAVFISEDEKYIHQRAHFLF
ncbi:MAG: hypothetical protein M3Z01_01675 [Thermoproteota archaeon]|nr:hypothetical protein [Thermoproteota archaeon]